LSTRRKGLVIGVLSVREDGDIMLITAQGMVNRTHVREIRKVGRNSQGVRIMNLGEGDRIASIAKVAHEDSEVAEEIAAETPPATEMPPTPSEE
jgi:DNA gyrase subunit A